MARPQIRDPNAERLIARAKARRRKAEASERWADASPRRHSKQDARPNREMPSEGRTGPPFMGKPGSRVFLTCPLNSTFGAGLGRAGQQPVLPCAASLAIAT